jgi:OOP family OmpA-OmpF porin
MGLSERRAESVKRYLSERGIGSDRLKTRGFGLKDPVAPNDSRDGRAKNRRVELKPGS